MSERERTTYGRAAMFGVLIALLLAIGIGVYIVLAWFSAPGPPILTAADAAAEETHRVARFSYMLAMLLISALLILLFVIGCYLVIFAGRILRKPVAGKVTEYVDVWQQYRLTEEQIAAATAEDPDSPPPEDPRRTDEPPADRDSDDT